MKQLIAVVGMAGSGKSVVTSYLEEQGFTKIYFGGAVLEEVKRQGLAVTPENEKRVRESLRKEQGMGVVAKLLLPKIKEAYEKGNTVLDGLYSWEEYLILKEAFGSKLKLLAVVTSKKLRYERIAKRKERPLQPDEIVRRDITEIENLAKGGPIAFADEFLINNYDKETCLENVRQILKKWEDDED